MSKTTTIKTDNVEYVRADASKAGEDFDGRQYVIVRSRDQGVMSGFLEDIEGTTVTILRARQLWQWDSAFVLPDLAESGIKEAKNCKFSEEMSQDMVILSACGVLHCTDKSMESIRAVPASGRS